MTAAALDTDTLARLTRHVLREEIPTTEDLFTAPDLTRWLAERGEPPLDLLAGGDVMLGGRTTQFIAARGPHYPFAAVRPLLEHAAVTLANLEGPLARHAARQERRFSYRVAPWTAAALAEAGIRVVTLANNHLMDCGRAGVTETLDTLARAGVRALGAGVDQIAAHAPAIVDTPNGTLGILGYYWNRRCAATPTLPGGAMDDDESLERDIAALRNRVDLLVVTSHWGIPYDRSPGDGERQRARRAIDLGADAVVAHHPHVVQALEIYRDRPIFYSVGNFAFGSGNSKAEGLLVGFRCEPSRLSVEVYSLYVKNRDPRVSYQPKVMRGRSARRVLGRLAELADPADARIGNDDARLLLSFPRRPRS